MKSYTSIEQSKKLLELGLNPETADMCWEQHYNKEPIITVKPYTTKGKSIGAHCCDAWSLGALLEAIPHIIKDDDYTNEITPLLYPMQGEWFCVYNELDTDGYSPYAEEKGTTPIEAVFNMIVWLFKNEYIKIKE